MEKGVRSFAKGILTLEERSLVVGLTASCGSVIALSRLLLCSLGV
jgi:hypothetical protein